ncbi:citryl-CoA lyase [Saccharococcus caldoxylosilyticus]|jgi:citrate synthase|uniref:citrate synthase (unknown stereospecificity) n=1 Tax=Saccharococcus caldoxylosilyticus TaxID=81408 RepID=A0A150LEC9_9BACL|nr:citryl-CoA lyase [Parageobacillus caldoxylosilyticus]OQP00659.1 citryl-CoA lyase [Geobacillus sp. 44B]KYD10713.1 Citrate synthase (si) [Parageobacillus caldoxylosilyticus]QNU36750.1 citryl-CoA lyase [Geobacillus sp. 44B]QXJ39962.1 Citrate synthase [Parageobacillus caldoxylosilyticus]BDG36427.1 citryl-CoA lyase [Parageobacillus caldoxylosilyticus]
MKQRSALDMYANGTAWWETSISNIKKNEIIIRGYPIEELIGNISYTQMLYLLLCGKILSEKKAKLLESVLVAGADHGPRAPSIAAARMAATCGISFNSCVATGINVLGDVHGGAVEKAMHLFYETGSLLDAHPEKELSSIVEEKFVLFQREGKKLPGFGHQLHDDDPRVRRLYALAQRFIEEGEIKGRYLAIAEAYRTQLERAKGKKITMNIDGVAAAIQCELSIPAEAAKGIFALSRGMGIVAHAFEELQNGVLIKGPCPNRDDLVRYSGPAKRHLEK